MNGKNETEKQKRATGASRVPAISRRRALKMIGVSAASLAFAGSSAPRAYAAKRATKRSYVILYKLRGGKNPKKQIVRVGWKKKLSVKKLKQPTRKGYTFDGWFSDAELETRASYVYGRAAKAKRRLYAGWSLATYELSYNRKGGAEIVTLPTSYTILTSTFSFARLVRDGYRFMGWYSDPDLSVSRSEVKKGSAGDLSLYARWEPVDYWSKHLNAQCDVVNGICEEAGSAAASFVFITDIHVPSNALVSPYLVKQVVAKTPAEMVVFGGDALNFHTKRSNAVDIMSSLKRLFSGTEFHYVRGNHDANSYNSAATAALALTDAEVIGMTASANEVRVPGCFYYHRDDEERHIRYLIVDSGVEKLSRMDDDQQTWFKDRILELDEQWTVVVLVHRFFAGDVAVDSDVYLPVLHVFGKDLRDAIDDVYEEAEATIAGVICGHNHRDYFERPSLKGYPYFVVETVCDAYAKAKNCYPDYDRLQGTIDEHAFDVVTLDTSNKLIHLTRIGWGHDRCYSYAQEAVSKPVVSVLRAATVG